MLIKKLIDKLRAKGYDDFYMANLASKYDQTWFLFIGMVQLILVVVLMVLMPAADIFKSVIAPSVILIPGCLFMSSFIPAGTIRAAKDNGETDLRITYMIESWISKFMLKVFHYAPEISMILLIVTLVGSIIMYGFRWSMLLSSAIGIVLLLVFSSLYHKLINKISKEGVYYVDWKTNQDVEHFEEIYSQHEKWWLSESEMEFEKFNIDRYRSIRLAAFIGTFGCLAAGLIFALSLSPLFGVGSNASVKKKDQVEQIANAEDSDMGQQNAPTTSLNTNVELAGTTDADVVENEDPIGDGDVPSKEPAEDVQPTSAEVLSLSEVDDMPTMSDGSNINSGIVSYLKSHIPELSEKKIDVEFKISETGHIYGVDASLVSDVGLRRKIEKMLTTMPIVKPARKDGHVVAVKTCILTTE